MKRPQKNKSFHQSIKGISGNVGALFITQELSALCIMSNSSNANTFVAILKQFIENPLAFISLIALGGIVFIYNDMRGFITQQTEAFREFTVAIQEQNLRIQHLEEYHLQELQRQRNVQKPAVNSNNE